MVGGCAHLPVMCLLVVRGSTDGKERVESDVLSAVMMTGSSPMKGGASVVECRTRIDG
jgi:hypothetical protein